LARLCHRIQHGGGARYGVRGHEEFKELIVLELEQHTGDLTGTLGLD
jgi:hypothetical protein